jgi:hypothetical protein
MADDPLHVSKSTNRGLPQGEKVFRVKNIIQTFGYGDEISYNVLRQRLPDVDRATIEHILNTEADEGRLVGFRIRRGVWTYLRVAPVTIRRIPE